MMPCDARRTTRRYRSFQGSGASSGGGGAPWCVGEWGVDGGLNTNIYPLDLATMQVME